jgi:GT2 family glycosyltransferase
VLILYNALELLKENFENIYTHVTHEEPEAEFLFVDNASSDGSPGYIRQHFPEAKVIQQGANRFFAVSANTGIQAARHELILLLNLDVKIAALQLAGVHQIFEHDPAIFSLSPKVIDPRDNAQEQLFCLKIQKGIIDLIEPADFMPEERREIPYGTGGALFLRKSYCLQIQGFRTIYTPFYWEDADLGIRAVANGWKNVYCPDPVFHHYHSSQISAYFSKKYIKTIYERNRLIFFFLHTKKLFWRLRFFAWLPFKLLYSLMTDTYFFWGIVEFLKIWNQIQNIPSQSHEHIIERFIESAWI